MRHPKKALLALVLAIAGLIPVALHAWGPDRPTFTIDKPASYVVFNSITNNPAHGDERNFVQIKESSASNSTYTDKIAIQPGKKYTVYVYFHNNAAANLKLVSTNTRANTQLPATVQAGQQATISAKIKSDNANPATVWDEAYVTSTKNVALKYVANSATIHSFGAVNGQKLNTNEFFTSGALIGYNALDGKVPGCHQFAGYITYEFVVEPTDKPDFKIEKTVSMHGERKFNKQVSTTDNKKVDFVIAYTNTGNTTQSNVVIKDILPRGLSYVKGSTQVANKNSGGKPVTVSDNIVTTGINIGTYAPGANAFIQFTATINDADCGKNFELVNTAQVITQDGAKADTAKVIVTTEACPVVVKDIKVCKLDTLTIATIKENEFDPKKHSKNLADCDKKVVVTPPAETEAPSELPKTGIADTLMQVMAIGSVVTSAGYYASSRKLNK